VNGAVTDRTIEKKEKKEKKGKKKSKGRRRNERMNRAAVAEALVCSFSLLSLNVVSYHLIGFCFLMVG